MDNVIVVVDTQALRRAALINLLEPWAAQHNMEVVGSPDDIPRPARLVLVSTGQEGAVEIPQKIIDSGVRLVAISHVDDPHVVRAAYLGGISSYIFTNLEPNLVLAALSFILMGGTYFPATLLARQSSPPPPPSRRDLDFTGLSGLTARQQEILQGLVHGESNKAIARNLNIAEATVKIHMRHIMRKTGTHNRTQVVLHSMRERAAATA